MSSTRIELLFPNMFIFGKNTKTGLVDIATPEDDTFISCSEEHANKLIEERDRLLVTLEEMTAIAKSHAPIEVDVLLGRKELVGNLSP